jgi:hypothetical protein
MNDPATTDDTTTTADPAKVGDESAGIAGRDEAQREPAPKAAYIGMGAAIGIGAGIGLVFGTMLDNIALGLACGAGLGTVAGAIMESGRRRR